MDPYDQFFYESIPFPETHPRHLASLGRLFGLETADPERCRLLELGCASGGDLIASAWFSPDSELLGIDLSHGQIARGRELIRRLDLKNIELRQGDILDLDQRLGRFDYIVAHGVYSWVPAPVREHILVLSRQLLRPGGLLYLSFNTLPGWRMRGMLRDILLYACRDADDASTRLERAHAALTRLERSLQQLDALSARYLREEIAQIRKAPPSYLLHEYLAGENNAFLFSEFLGDAGRAGLRYLCDAELAGLFPSTFGEAVEDALADIGDDMEVEQWLDFVGARNFRRALLCRDDARVEDALSLDIFAGFAFSSALVPPPKVDLRRSKPISFREPDGTPVAVRHPLTRALLLEMHARQPDLVPLETLLSGASERLRRVGAGQPAGDREGCLMELFSLFCHRSVSASPRGRSFGQTICHRPAISSLARGELAAGQRHLSTAQHGSLDLDPFSRLLLLHLDGGNDLEALCDRLCAEIRGGVLAPPGGVGTGGRLRGRVAEECRGLIGLFARCGILDSGASAKY